VAEHLAAGDGKPHDPHDHPVEQVTEGFRRRRPIVIGGGRGHKLRYPGRVRGVANRTTIAIAFAVLLGSGAATLRPGTSAPVALVERAQAAGRFTDSIGINLHLSYHNTGYADTGRVTALLRQLGVRHLRDGVALGQTDVCRADRALAADGLRFTYITQANPTAAQLMQWVSCVGPATEAFEGLNEYDISHPQSDTNWVGTVRSSQQDLYRSIKGTPALASLKVVGPSLTSEAAFRAVGDLTPLLDAGNMHDYFAAHEPETPGWGLGGYGSIAYNLRVARVVDPDKPIQSTETGYGTDRAERTVDDATQATYLPRLFLQHFADGIPRTYSYELIDEGGQPFDHYGIVNADLSPKPAFTALSSLIAVLRDTSDNFSSGTLHFTIDGGNSDLHHVLMQRHDGHYVLALWIAASSYDPTAHQPKPVPAQTIGLQVAAPLSSAAAYTYGSDWRLHKQPLSTKLPMQLTIGDRVTLVEIAPAHG
jgi:hypothetical protein